MSISLDKDCVIMRDGTTYCYDRYAKCCYIIEKKKVSVKEMPEDAVMQLLENLHSQQDEAV